MEPPVDPNLPLFAYGLFRPGQIAFFRVRDFVEHVEPQISIPGLLWNRDGLPLFDPAGGYGSDVVGSLLTFRSGQSVEAYAQIIALKPGAQYEWGTARIGSELANVLVGRAPDRGGKQAETGEWDTWADKLFTSALDVVQETILDAGPYSADLKPLFRLHMAYLLLWSSIERYASFRHNLDAEPMQKLKHLASEDAFAQALQRRVSTRRTLYRATTPEKRAERLIPENPKRSMGYYYAVRSNAAHRGKAAGEDIDILRQSAEELLSIFSDMLEAAETESRKPVG